MSSTHALLVEHFREQAVLCVEYGSPFTGSLIARMGADFEAGGPIADLIGTWNTHPRADALTMRLCGALHAAALTGRDPALAAAYPESQPNWSMDVVWPIAREFIARDKAWVTEFIRSAPQTNEVRRSIALLAGFLTFANEYAGEIEMLEIGASAGLNLNWDRFSYRTASWSWGQPGGVSVDTEWSGPSPPLSAAPRIRSRAACDLNPLDVSDPAQRLQLRSYVWADQRDRLARFDAAADLAVATGQKVERANAAEWLARRLAARAKDAATVVYHSVFLQYPPPADRNAIIAAIQNAGATATPEAPVAWLRLEAEALLGGARDSVRFWVELITWPGAVRRLLAITDGHVRTVTATAVSQPM
jgi:hypothetical protein